MDQEIAPAEKVEEPHPTEQNEESCDKAESRDEDVGLKRTFRSLFRGNRDPTKGLRLHYVEPELVDTQCDVNITAEDVADEIQF